MYVPSLFVPVCGLLVVCSAPQWTLWGDLQGSYICKPLEHYRTWVEPLHTHPVPIRQLLTNHEHGWSELQ